MNNSEKKYTENILKSFKSKDSLNSKIWSDPENVDEAKIKDKIYRKLVKIASEFKDFLGLDLKVDDVQVTGSLANYNWSEFSDIDLHLIIDYSQFNKTQKELVSELFKLKKTLFNMEHDIKIYDFDVELYAQDKDEYHASEGVYSLLKKEWIKKPKRTKENINKDRIREKSKEWIQNIDKMLNYAEEEDLDDAKKLIKLFKEKIKKYRSCGLEKGGEYSEENLVFKVLRRLKYIDKIYNFEKNLIDKKLSIKESRLINESAALFGDNPPNWGKNGYVMGPKYHASRGFGNWQSDNAWDIFQKPNTPVYSITKGTVSNVKQSSGKNPKVYGTQVSVKGTEGYSDVFYTHLTNVTVTKGSTVVPGDKIGDISPTVGGMPPHVHIGLPYGTNISTYLDESGRIKNADPTKKTKDKTGSPIKDKILAFFGLGKSAETSIISPEKQEKIDDPKKADIVTGSKEDLLDTLSTIDQTLTQQKRGSTSYQKQVEAVQIALQLLGYELPKFGVDGLFGSETASAISKFKKDHNLKESFLNIKKILEEATLNAPLDKMKVTSPYGPRWGRFHHGVDLGIPTGTDVKSPADGIVTDASIRNDACGGTLKIDHGGGIATRYCHLSRIIANKGEEVSQGEVVAKSGGGSGDPGRGRSTGPHLHFEVYKDGKSVNPKDFLNASFQGGDYSKVVTTGVAEKEKQGGETITKKFVEKLIDLIKSKNIESAEIKKFVDSPKIGTSPSDQEFYEKVLEGIGAPVTDENMKFLYAWRQAEGGTATFNPFNTTLKLTKDEKMTNYNSVGVKNYSTASYGLEATLKTLRSGYDCIVNGLKNDIGAKKISSCPDLGRWKTGKSDPTIGQSYIGAVIDSYERGNAIKPKPIQLA